MDARILYKYSTCILKISHLKKKAVDICNITFKSKMHFGLSLVWTESCLSMDVQVVWVRIVWSILHLAASSGWSTDFKNLGGSTSRVDFSKRKIS